jgi:hypothetical protein
MRVFAVQIAQQRLKTLRVPAISIDAARSAAEFILQPGDRIRAITEQCDVTPASGRAALDHLLAREYLELDGAPMLVEDWLLSARKATAQHLNAKLALAGIRVDEQKGRVSIASAACVPVLHHWFMGTPWEGTSLIHALATMPGANRVNLTYAGVRSRSISLPFDMVLPSEVAA